MSAEDDYFAHARKEMFPKMKSSALSIVIAGEPDPKLCLELGAAILFDKPLIVVAPTGHPVPVILRRIASAVIEGDINDFSTKQRLQDAIAHVIDTDERIKH